MIKVKYIKKGLTYLSEIFINNNSIEFLSLPRNKLKNIDPIINNIM